jgi:hypothetical protein
MDLIVGDYQIHGNIMGLRKYRGQPATLVAESDAIWFRAGPGERAVVIPAAVPEAKQLGIEAD